MQTPPPDRIIEHACEECFSVQRDFSGRSWRDVPPELVRKHHDVLPLFAPPAFHSFLPAYLLLSLQLDDPLDWDVQHMTIFSLDPEEKFVSRLHNRIQLFSAREIDAVVGFLEFFAEGGAKEDFVQEATDALSRIWYPARTMHRKSL